MKIKFLSAINFRKFKDIELEFEEKNALFGPNGSGKTSLLEAIYTLAWGKSFRALRDSESIRWGERSANLSGEFEGEDILNVRVLISNSSKKIYLNGKPSTRASLIGKIPVLFISPDELAMLDGPPKVRRDFLNKVLSQLDEEYLSYYRKYLKLLKEKNSALSKGEKNAKLLEILNERLLKLSLPLWEKRRNLLERLSDEELKIVYKPSGMKLELESDSISRCLYSLLDKEMKRGYAMFGPHLDEFDVVKKEGFSYRRFGSRGERKSVIWRLFNKIIGIFEEREKFPIFLIDEILSELDQYHIEAVMRDIGSLKVQVFLTTLNRDQIKGDFRFFEVSDGEVRKYN